jgi:Fe-S cluster assembly scaffold protein SufB
VTAARPEGTATEDRQTDQPRPVRATGKPARPVRRAPTDLPFGFADRGLAQALAAEREEPDWLRALRVAAFERFEELPVETNRLYTTYVDLRPAELEDVVPYVRTASEPKDAAHVPADASALVEIDEDGLTALALDAEARGAGLRIDTFGGLLGREPKALRALLEADTMLPANDKLAYLARGFWSQGLVVRVPDGVRLERPIVLRWLTGRPGRALITRTIVSIGRGSAVTFLEELGESQPWAGPGSPQHLFAGTLEIRLADGASLGVASLQELGEGAVAFQHRAAEMGQDAALRWALAQLGGALVKSRVDNRLLGRGSSVEQVEIVFGGGEQLFDLTSHTRHVGEDTTGTITSRGAMLGSARAFMKGLITIERTALGTDSFLGEFGMHLTKRARSVAIPSLEIDQPNVRRAAHSSSVGPIDENQVFYLMTRGLPDDLARKFVVMGFLEPVVARVPLADAQERLRERLEGKWEDNRPAAIAA